MRAAFSDNICYADKISELLNRYRSSGFAAPSLTSELATLDPEKIQAAIWEAMLYRHFEGLGASFLAPNVTKAGQNGPDLGINLDGIRLWVEAVVPTPTGLPDEWLAPIAKGEFKVWKLPHEEILLRYTSALVSKKKQLDDRRAKGIVSADDAYVIAVNGCLLSAWPGGESHGITQWPFIVEAVFPIGPLTIRVGADGKFLGDARNSHRPSIRNANKSDVPLDNFLNEDWAGISAVIWCGRKDHLAGLPLLAVHNPKAYVPIPSGALGIDRQHEYSAEDDGEGGYIIHQPGSG